MNFSENFTAIQITITLADRKWFQMQVAAISRSVRSHSGPECLQNFNGPFRPFDLSNLQDNTGEIY